MLIRGGLAMNATMHCFHLASPHIEVSIMRSQIAILRSVKATSPNDAKAVQMTEWCGLNPPSTNQEQNG